MASARVNVHVPARIRLQPSTLPSNRCDEAGWATVFLIALVACRAWSVSDGGALPEAVSR